MGERDAGIEALLGAHLEHEPRSQNPLAQVLALLHTHPHGLLHEHVLAGLDGLSGGGHVELVRHSDDDRLDVRVGEHRFIVRVRNARGVDGGHLLEKILRDVADGVQFGVARFAAGLEVGELGDRSAAEDPYPQEWWFLSHTCLSYSWKCRSQSSNPASDTNSGGGEKVRSGASSA